MRSDVAASQKKPSCQVRQSERRTRATRAGVVRCARFLWGETMRRTIALLAALLPVAAALADDAGYPKRIDFDSGHVLVHAPQIHSWEDFEQIEGVSVLEAYPDGSEDAVYAGALFTASTQADVDRRIVTVSDLEVVSVSFADGKPAKAAHVAMLKEALPKGSREIPLDLVISHMADEVAPTGDGSIKAEPPVVHYATSPSLIVLVQGEPILASITEKGKMRFVANTNWPLFTDVKQKRWYLLHGTEWLTSKTLDGAWSYAGRLPKELRKLPDEANWAKARKAAVGWKKPKKKVAPAVIASTVPAELIVTVGEPRLVSVTGDLEVVTNTVSRVFRHESSWYYLVSGRWFSSRRLDAGPWVHVTTLPADFQQIPADGPEADIRASVPGTAEARAAVIEAQLPRKAQIARDAKPSGAVVYAGDPEFEPIETTGVSRAVNTPFDVFAVGGKYYWCSGGAWYVSDTPSGSWSVAIGVPSAIYTIPASSPSYHVTYVHMYGVTPGYVSYGYTSGYGGMYVSFGLAVWGTGYYYPPYYGYHPYYPAYYPYPYTYGGSSFYNPRTGTYGSTSRAYGPYGGWGYTSAYNPRTGTYASAESMWDNNEWAGVGSAVNPRTGRSFETARYYNADDNRWEIDSRLAGQRGSVDVRRTRDDGRANTQYSTSRGGSGEFNRQRTADGGSRTSGQATLADGRQVTTSGSFQNGQGTSTISGSRGGEGTINRSVDGNTVRREGTFARDGQSVSTTTRRDGARVSSTAESSSGARAASTRRGTSRTTVGQSASGDLYGSRNGNVYRRSSDGWQQRSNGSWNQVQPRSSGSRNSATMNSRNRSQYQNLNRSYSARQRGMSSMRTRGGFRR